MAALLFMQLFDDGGNVVKGEVDVESHQDWIELEGCNWNMEQRTERQGTVPGKAPNYAKPKVFTFKKFPDSSSTRMMQAHVDDTEFQKAVFHLYEELQGSENDTGGIFDLTITLSKVTVKSYKLNGNSSDKSVELSEDWELDYKTIEFKHKSAGAAVTIAKPREPDKTEGMGGAKGGATGAGGNTASGDAAGLRDFLSPLGSL